MIVKNIVVISILLMLSLVSYSQKDVTQFLGIPVDGSKNEMIEKLKSKGFTISNYDDDTVLEGQFNGSEVNIFIVTNNDKVYRIMIADVIKRNETDIKIRFNNLLHQFKKNDKYVTASLTPEEYVISEEEKISYEMHVNNKRYEASFYQIPSEIDTVGIMQEVLSELSSKYTEEEISNPTKELQKEILTIVISYTMEIYSKKSVWFMINELYGKYYITMFYDNEYNKAQGEDL